MKIIGYTDKETYIITASANELAKLSGVQYSSNLEKQPSVGDEININDLYKSMTKLKEQKAKFEAAIQTIQQVNSQIS